MAERWLKHSGLRHHMLALFTTRFPEHGNDIGGALLWMLPIADLPPSPLCFLKLRGKKISQYDGHFTTTITTFAFQPEITYNRP